jgi:hypothetical protein
MTRELLDHPRGRLLGLRDRLTRMGPELCDRTPERLVGETDLIVASGQFQHHLASRKSPLRTESIALNRRSPPDGTRVDPMKNGPSRNA